MGFVPEKQLKKYGDSEPKLSIRAEGSKTDKRLLPGRVLCLLGPTRQLVLRRSNLTLMAVRTASGYRGRTKPDQWLQ
jgi:hypothetical protein